jgi:hypothetical protein
MTNDERPLLLLVEDDPDWQTSLQGVLSSDYLIKACHSRQDAENTLDVLRALGVKPAVCILDPTIPNSPPQVEAVAEYEVGEGFARSLVRQSIPYVILTGHPGTARILKAFKELETSGYYEKLNFTEEQAEFQSKLQEISTNPGPPLRPMSEPMKEALLKYLTALIGITLSIFVILTIVALVIPKGVVLAVIPAGVTLVIFIVISLALFIGRITGKQYGDIVREIRKNAPDGTEQSK